jgi:hypothetical protein
VLGPTGKAARIAVEVEHRRHAGCGRLIPAEKLNAVAGLYPDLFDAAQSDLGRRLQRSAGLEDVVALEDEEVADRREIDGDQNRRDACRRLEDTLLHVASIAP